MMRTRHYSRLVDSNDPPQLPASVQQRAPVSSHGATDATHMQLLQHASLPEQQSTVVASLRRAVRQVMRSAAEEKDFEVVAPVPLPSAIAALVDDQNLVITRHRRKGGLYLSGCRSKNGECSHVPLMPLWAHQHPDVHKRFPRPDGLQWSRIVAEAHITNGIIYQGPPPPCSSPFCDGRLRCSCPEPPSVGILCNLPGQKSSMPASLHVYSPQMDQAEAEQITIDAILLGTGKPTRGTSDRWHLGAGTRIPSSQRNFGLPRTLESSDRRLTITGRS